MKFNSYFKPLFLLTILSFSGVSSAVTQSDPEPEPTTRVNVTQPELIHGLLIAKMAEVDFPYTIRNMTVCDVKSLENFAVDEFTIIYPDKIYIRHVKYFPMLSLVLDINKSVEGFIIGSYTTMEGVLYGHITSIFIAERFRGCGFGGKLMSEFEENSRMLECRFVNLFVNDRNKPAIEFYKKRGYYVYKKMPKYYNDKEDALEMRKTIL